MKQSELSALSGVCPDVIRSIRRGNTVTEYSVRKICEAIDRDFVPEEWPNHIVYRKENGNPYENLSQKGLSIAKLRACVNVGDKLKVPYGRPDVSSISLRNPNSFQLIKGTVLNKYSNWALVELKLPSMPLKKGYLYFELYNCLKDNE